MSLAFGPLAFRLAGPVVRRLPPELAHQATLTGLRLGAGLGLISAPVADPILATTLWGRSLPHPVGLAAGFDKEAGAVDALLALGFSFVEAGGVTPLPQPGNPRPRVFRLAAEEAVINRMGFNSGGLAAFRQRLAARQARPGPAPGLVGVNLGKNRDSTDATSDYVAGIRALAPLAGFLVINVSSPNTPGLRALQGRDRLAALLDEVMAARAAAMEGIGTGPPLLVKLAPDLGEDDKTDIAAVALAAGIDGLIIGNTTLSRPPGLPPALAAEAGGLSGRPLFALSTAVLSDFYRLTGGRLPLIGTGGIASAADAYAKIRAGASAVQLYTALIYRGPALLREILDGLAVRLRADGFPTLAAATGADHRPAAGAP